MKSKLKIALLAGMTALLLSGPALAKRTDPLVNPSPVAVPAGMDQQHEAKEIRRALLSQNWIIATEAPGAFTASLQVDDHVLKVRVTYDATKAEVRYAESTNLNYAKDSKDGEIVHPRVMEWMNDLRRAIGVNFDFASKND